MNLRPGMLRRISALDGGVARARARRPRRARRSRCYEVRSATARTEHSDQVLLRSNDLERKVIDLETGLRGYAITRDHVFLRPMLAAQKGIPRRARRRCRRSSAATPRRSAARSAISDAVWTYARYWLIPRSACTSPTASSRRRCGRASAASACRRSASGSPPSSAPSVQARATERASGRDVRGASWSAIMVASLLGARRRLGRSTVRRLRRGGVAAAVDDLTAKLEASDARNDELLEELERQSRIDRLTGIANRAGVRRAAREECTAARRHCGDLSMLLLDIDGLGRDQRAARLRGRQRRDAADRRRSARRSSARATSSRGSAATSSGSCCRARRPRRRDRRRPLQRKIAAEPATAVRRTIAVRAAIGVASAAHGADAERPAPRRRARPGRAQAAARRGAHRRVATRFPSAAPGTRNPSFRTEEERAR